MTAMPGARSHTGDALEHLAATVKAILGRPASAQERERFSAYLELLRTWNRTHRLTGFDSAAAIVKGLFEDSLLFLPLLPARPLRLVDIGAGAGIPGVPIRLVDPEVSLTLIEARRKRVSFLSTLVRHLGLGGVEVLHGRAERLIVEQPELKGKFDAAVSRAAGPLGSMMPWVLDYLRPEGLFVSSGPPPGTERRIRAPLTGSWREVHYATLGLKRKFLVVSKKS